MLIPCLPHINLRPYIEFYYRLETTKNEQDSTVRIYPDACTDILISYGTPFYLPDRKDIRVQQNKPVLFTTMTTFFDAVLKPETCLYGIRFKPFGLFNLLGISLKGMHDSIVELSPNEFCIKWDERNKNQLEENLNTYFLKKLALLKSNNVSAFSDSVYRHFGNISISKLAALHHTTAKQIERTFEHLSVGAKEVCKQIRFQYALREIQQTPSVGFSRIALETGYYDYAHFSKEIKRYTGCAPSAL